jgi:hypothetical protein
MPIFHVYLNGKKVATAGVGELGVLGAHVSWVGRAGDPGSANKTDSVQEELTLDVGGLVSPAQEHVSWLDRNLKVGDEVRISIAASGRVGRARRRERRNRAKELRAQKQYVREMAQRFGWKLQEKK